MDAHDLTVMYSFYVLCGNNRKKFVNNEIACFRIVYDNSKIVHKWNVSDYTYLRFL
jgi:hypothetical protein